LIDEGGASIMDKDQIGAEGERLAALYLRAYGFKVLYKNYRASLGGEVDIVARETKTLCFIEVKTRTSLKYGRPIEAVTLDKQHLITRGAVEWLRLLEFNVRNFRFDVIEVLLVHGKAPAINLVRQAFELPDSYII
jgi:putative endonuclease